MDVKIYTLSYCPYCAAAKNFLDSKNVQYVEYKLDGNEEEEFMRLKKEYNIQGDVTAPQIIIDGVRIGGYSDMMSLFELGKLKF